MSSQHGTTHRPSRLLEQPRERASDPALMPDEALTLWLGATRYYLGRMSYGVGNYCDLLIRMWRALPEETQLLIRRDVEEQFERDDEARRNGERGALPLGMDMDRKQWERVRGLWQ